MNNQVDLSARKHLCGLMRQFAIGRITNDEFDESYENIVTDDRTANSIVLNTLAYYNDYATVRLRGKYRLCRDDRRMVARWVLFLQSGLTYRNVQPPFRILLRAFLSSLTLGLVTKGREVEQDEYYQAALWPFATQAEFDEARQHPKLLCGQSA